MGDMQLYTKEQVIQIVEKSRATGLTAEYLLLNYGSKGSDDSPKVQNKDSFGEISDEEIEKAVMDSMDYVYLNPNDSLIFHQGWMRAIKWYREQLKQRQ